MAERPTEPASEQDFAARNGWDREYEAYDDFDLPTYVGPSTFMNLPWVTEPDELRRRGVDVAIVGAPFDDAVSHRPGARFGPRAIREAQYTSGSINSLQLGVEPFEVLTVVDAGDANIVPAWIERAHAIIYRKVREVAEAGALPIVLGGDHSITWPSATAIAEVHRPGQHRDRPFRCPRRHRDGRLGRARRPRHADAPPRRVGRGPGPQLRPGRTARLLAAGGNVRMDARAGPALAPHDARSRSAARRRSSPTRSPKRSTARTHIYLSVDIDVLDPGLAPGTGTPEPGGLLPRELLRAVRQIVGAVDLVAMDIVEVSPPYDHAETTAMAANRLALEAISALAVRRKAGTWVRR